MKFARTCIALVAIIAPGSLSGQATPQARQSETDSADRLFMLGHDFFKPYAVTFDFQNMQIFLEQKR